MGGGNPCYQNRLRDVRMEHSPVEKDLWVLVDGKLAVSQRCALAAQKNNQILGCIKRVMVSRVREVILYAHGTSPGVLHPDMESSVQERCGPVGAHPEGCHKNDSRVEHLSYGDRLRELGLFSLEKKRLREDLRAAFQLLKGGYKKDGDILFSRTRRNGFKLKHGRFKFGKRSLFLC